MTNEPVRTLRARWVFPVDRAPLEGGVVVLNGERIAEVRPFQPGEAAEDLGDVALIPGLVNAHAHLEFSSLAAPLGEPGMAFTDWLRLVVAYRIGEEEQTGDRSVWRSEGAQRGIAESLAAGVAAIGEIATTDWAEKIVNQAPLDFTVFCELLGLARERIEPLWEQGQAHVELGTREDRRWRPGLSPHAPYSVHPELLERVCRLSAERRFPVAMHLAESIEEIEFLISGSGRMAEFLQQVKAFPPQVIPRGARPLDYLERLATADRAIVVHGNLLSEEEIAFLGERSERMSVAYCPRTHANFLPGEHPLPRMLAANVNVCLGTDSRASNPDLRLLEEMRFVARRYSSVTPEGVLYLGTQAGADALGIGERFGSLTPGKSSRLAVVKLTQLSASDPHELLFADGTEAGPLR
jgi:aminodeoxyfutalosine deaminase